MGFEATAATIIATSLVLTATGANAKINAEASHVFGKDVVNLANIAGSIYLATSGGSTGGGGEEAVSGMDLAADAGQGATGANGITGAANAAAAGAASDASALDAAGVQFGGGVSFGGTPAPSSMFDTAGQGFQVDPFPGDPSSLSAPQFGNGALSQAANGPAPGQVAAPTAPAVPATTNSTTLSVAKPGATDGVDLLSRAGTAWKNLGDRGQGALIQVAGGALQGYGQAQQQQNLLDQQRTNDAKYRSGSGLAYWQAKPSYTKPGG